MKKLIIGMVTGLVLILLASTMTWGLVTNWRFTAHVDIQPGIGISVFNNAEFTEYRTGFEFFNPVRESSSYEDYYVLNTSLDILTVTADSTLEGTVVNLRLYTDTADINTLPVFTIPYGESFTLNPSQQWYVWMEVFWGNTTPLGESDFEIWLNTEVLP